MNSQPLRIALLTHSTNPRGGVVHTLELAEALTRLGHCPVVFAPDATGRGFFRPTFCETRCIPAQKAAPDVAAMAAQRIADYLGYFADADCGEFDIWHAQDSISGNVLATLKARGRIPGFVRTVHHVDHFADAELAALQRRAIASADRLLTVSHMWQDWLRRAYSRESVSVGNGVDTSRFSPVADMTDNRLRMRLGLASDAPAFLAVGGIEARKNTLGILEAFGSLHAEHPAARLVIAGGASLLDHSAYQARFSAALAASGLPPEAIIRTGPLPQDLMPALYRAATALVFPSLREGFGLVVLEAMASGIPAIVPRVAPFTEYLAPEDALWCVPEATETIVRAMRAALEPALRARLTARGLARAKTMNWSRVAEAHLAQYAAAREPCHA